jgi:hypothetical protein
VAIETLEGLRTCSDGPDLYQLKAPHRLLLTDVLVRYCDLFNEDPCGGYDSEVHAKYGLRHLDGTRLIAAFIGTEYALTECGGVQRDEGGYAANVAHGQVDAVTVRGQRLRDQDLALHRVAHGSDQANIVPATGSPWYRVGVCVS